MKIDQHTLVVLSRCTTVGQNLYLPPEQLERPDYLAVNKVIEAMGGKWNRSQKAHVFAGSVAQNELDAVLESGEIATARDLSFFRTQGEALDLLMKAADVRLGHVVLEPSGGEGDIVRECLTRGARKLVTVEVDPKRANALRAIRPGVGVGYNVIEADFLAGIPENQFDRVVMNPPFTVSGDRRADLTHVLHATKFVAPGGRLAAIMSAGISFREDARTRAFLSDISRHGPVTVEPMPAGAFSASGTGVNTVLLTVQF